MYQFTIGASVVKNEIIMTDFVTFEIAKKLKEKGFREKCLGFYTSTNSFYYNNTNVCSDVSDLLECCNESEEYDDIDAPTISQVLKWLREEKKMHIIIPASFDEGYWWEVRDFNREISEYSDNEFDSYEKAAIAGIEYVIDNLI